MTDIFPTQIEKIGTRKVITIPVALTTKYKKGDVVYVTLSDREPN